MQRLPQTEAIHPGHRPSSGNQPKLIYAKQVLTGAHGCEAQAISFRLASEDASRTRFPFISGPCGLAPFPTSLRPPAPPAPCPLRRPVLSRAHKMTTVATAPSPSHSSPQGETSQSFPRASIAFPRVILIGPAWVT